MRYQPLDPEEITRRLNEIPEWRVEAGATADSRELFREYRFPSFLAALQFMHELGPVIEKLNHHPRWQNNFRTVGVWLTSWDAACQLTEHDFALAKQIDAYFNSLRKSQRDAADTERKMDQ